MFRCWGGRGAMGQAKLLVEAKGEENRRAMARESGPAVSEDQVHLWLQYSLIQHNVA